MSGMSRRLVEAEVAPVLDLEEARDGEVVVVRQTEEGGMVGGAMMAIGTGTVEVQVVEVADMIVVTVVLHQQTAVGHKSGSSPVPTPVCIIGGLRLI